MAVPYTRTLIHLYPPKVLAAETDIFSSILGRTDLKIGASKAKNCEEFDFEVRLPVRPPNYAQKGKKCCPTPKNFVKRFFFQPKIDLTGIV